MDWILYNARLKGDTKRVDVAIEGQHISAIEPAGTTLVNGEAAQHRDLAGRVLLPGLIDAHTHLDKTFSTLENESGTLLEAIEVWQRFREQRTAADFTQAAQRAIRLAIANGVTAIRSHIDIGEPSQLTAVEALLELRESVRHQIDLQFVALGDSSSSVQKRKGMEEALRLGVDYVGGVPGLRSDPQAEIDAIFELAHQTGKPIDLHVDESEDPNMLSLEYLAEQTIEHSMQGQVTAGHCCSLAFVETEAAKRVIDKVAAAEINIVTLPSCNLVLMGRHLSPVPRGTTRVKELLAAGVNICAASDNVHDPFNPFGSYDLLQIASLNAHTAHMTGRDELYESLEMVTTRAANALGLAKYGIAVVNVADLVVLESQQPLDAVLAPPPRLATFKRGQLIVETKIEQTWSLL